MADETKCANGHVWLNQFSEDWTPDRLREIAQKAENLFGNYPGPCVENSIIAALVSSARSTTSLEAQLSTCEVSRDVLRAEKAAAEMLLRRCRDAGTTKRLGEDIDAYFAESRR